MTLRQKHGLAGQAASRAPPYDQILIEGGNADMWTKTGTWAARETAFVTEPRPVHGEDYAPPHWRGEVAVINDANLESAAPAAAPASPARAREPEAIDDSWQQWLSAYKEAAGRVNSMLAVNEKGGSLVDFMDRAPLQKAYLKGMCPRTMGRLFGAQFEL